MMIASVAAAALLFPLCVVAQQCSSITDGYTCSAQKGCGWCSPQSAYVSGTSCCLTLPPNLAPGQEVSCDCPTNVNVFAVILTILGMIAFCVCVGVLTRRYCCGVRGGGGYSGVSYQQFSAAPAVQAIPVQGVPLPPGAVAASSTSYGASGSQSMQYPAPAYYAPAGRQGYGEDEAKV
jgi:hypothetical protein